jgi:TolB-like protein/Tfp pilus assembly protein PilF
MSDATKAVFLSYAREDADAARRVAEALRSSGVEVWFDQNELRGGDAWDAKIRKQIGDCTLFLPIISRNTQERGKGYFRLEWKLAIEQTHLMAAGLAFLVPVVVDDTPENGAIVPPEFMRVHWTRLPGALPTPQFVGQVKRMLDGPGENAGWGIHTPPTDQPAGRARPPMETGRPHPAERSEGTAPPTGKAVPRWTAGSITAIVVGIGVALWVSHKPEPPTVPASAAVEAKPAAAAVAPAPLLSAKSIAVLPFANLSTDKENEFFADGVHDDVITNLAKIRDLKVISRTSVLAYRDPAARNLKKIAAELGVATVLEGSIRRVGSKVHMNAQLIDARTDEHLWADTFDGDTADIFALQARLAKQIAAALKATLTGSEEALIERKPTDNPEAYELYQRARALQESIGEAGQIADYNRVLVMFDQALDKDPNLALAHTQKAGLHSILYWFGYFDPSPERAAKVKAEADAAVRLAPEAPETHLALGTYYYRVQRDWARALQEFDAAEAGLPNDAQVCFWQAVTRRRLGRWREAYDWFGRSAALNPRNRAAVLNYVQFLAEGRRYGTAVQLIDRALPFFPEEHDLLQTRAEASFAQAGDASAYVRALRQMPTGTLISFRAGDLYRAALAEGDLAAADRVLAGDNATVTSDALHGTNAIPFPGAFYRAQVAFLRGDRAAARSFAGQAREFFAHGSWNPRQRSWVRLELALAAAYAGAGEEVLPEAVAAAEALNREDAYDGSSARTDLALVQSALGHPDAACATLRAALAGPCSWSPNELRASALWAALRGRPEFEDILKSARPLGGPPP